MKLFSEQLHCCRTTQPLPACGSQCNTTAHGAKAPATNFCDHAAKYDSAESRAYCKAPCIWTETDFAACSLLLFSFFMAVITNWTAVGIRSISLSLGTFWFVFLHTILLSKSKDGIPSFWDNHPRHGLSSQISPCCSLRFQHHQYGLLPGYRYQDILQIFSTSLPRPVWIGADIVFVGFKINVNFGTIRVVLVQVSGFNAFDTFHFGAGICFYLSACLSILLPMIPPATP